MRNNYGYFFREKFLKNRIDYTRKVRNSKCRQLASRYLERRNRMQIIEENFLIPASAGKF